jgi:hypothetical protein
MLLTGLADLLGIDLPIGLAPVGPGEQVQLAAVVSSAGGRAASVPPCVPATNFVPNGPGYAS